MLLRREGESWLAEAPAKLNLFLEILGKRPDGFHELETLMVTVGLYDSLSFTEERSGRILLRCFPATSVAESSGGTSSIVPEDETNLVVRAARLLREHAGVQQGVRIALRKRIPAAAGLAGGSSDAAATLGALNRLWKLGLPAGELRDLASQLGSDVPFFLRSCTAALASGRGEELEPLTIPCGLHFVIACPASGLSTAVVYRHCRPATQPRSFSRLASALQAGRLKQAGALMYNALQSPAEELNPDVGNLLARLSREAVYGHMMSGSGSACFVLCGGARQARQTAARLRSAASRVFVVRCRP